MSQAQQISASSPEQPNDPPPQEEPTHDVPVYPERDPPPGQESAHRAAGGKEDEGAPGTDPVEPEDVDEDDLDPRKPHHPPDAGKEKIIFDENKVAS
jgi:hypothetical protein